MLRGQAVAAPLGSSGIQVTPRRSRLFLAPQQKYPTRLTTQAWLAEIIDDFAARLLREGHGSPKSRCEEPYGTAS